MSVTVLLVIALVLVAALTAGGIAVRTVSRIWLRHWAERRLRGAAAAITYLERPQRLVAASAAGVAFTLVLSGVLLSVHYDRGPLLGAVAGWAVVVVLVGQLIARAVGRRWAGALTPALLPLLRGAELIALPLLNLGRRIVLATGSVHGEPEPAPGDHDAIKDLLREGELEGVGEHDEIAIITGVVSFGEKRVSEVMIGRDEIFAVSRALAPGEVARAVAQTAYSRIPVYEGTLDNVVGMYLAFDVLKVGDEELPALRRVATASPDSLCNELLSGMLRDRVHLAIVRDADGRTVGLATMEDLLEELVGDIRDEHDEPAPSTPTAS